MRPLFDMTFPSKTDRNSLSRQRNIYKQTFKGIPNPLRNSDLEKLWRMLPLSDLSDYYYRSCFLWTKQFSMHYSKEFTIRTVIIISTTTPHSFLTDTVKKFGSDSLENSWLPSRRLRHKLQDMSGFKLVSWYFPFSLRVLSL